MKNSIYHKADTRGHADHGWLDSHQTFSFADYYNSERIHFGALRVLNDDVVAGGRGFGSHPHDNMEIISIPLEGGLVHEDNLGNKKTVSAGEVQVMSTGEGVFHSEFNSDPLKQAKFLQIWVFPNKLNVTPRYDQIRPDPEKRQNKLQQIISPDPQGEGTWIYQDAWFHLGEFDKENHVLYNLKKEGNGIYLFVINGSFTIDDQVMNKRDGLGVWDVKDLKITAREDQSELLVMEVPMKFLS